MSLKSNVATCLPNSSFAIFSAIFYWFNSSLHWLYVFSFSFW
jgi:hypothetical protein